MLDFANTVYRREPELGPDLLGSADDLAGWLAHASLLPAGHTGRVSDTALRDARELRGVCWAVFDAQRDGRELPPDAVAGLLDRARQNLTDVTVQADGSATAHTVAGALTVLALRAIGLVLRPTARPVRTCDGCGWFFVDSSRGRRRRWCSMQTCGNQAKAARYRSAH
ncbi:ABATE domain-containing protein [Mycolicibacterium sp. S2-37]|uniref:CGNR zinc finger domain-containing protein n=1 Tax=Mycolicibacterium sp. S2-37 TaxID=2810297 RepID=UPI0027DA15CB|nr:ABATE domain-containing protein [Mycolicibacterium sp. S2-37]